MFLVALEVQAALIIRGLGIRDFDISRVRKQGKTTNSKQETIKKFKQAYISGFGFLRFKFLRSVIPTNS